jgi:hypothetical protein
MVDDPGIVASLCSPSRLPWSAEPDDGTETVQMTTNQWDPTATALRAS